MDESELFETIKTVSNMRAEEWERNPDPGLDEWLEVLSNMTAEDWDRVPEWNPPVTGNGDYDAPSPPMGPIPSSHTQIASEPVQPTEGGTHHSPGHVNSAFRLPTPVTHITSAMPTISSDSRLASYRTVTPQPAQSNLDPEAFASDQSPHNTSTASMNSAYSEYKVGSTRPSEGWYGVGADHWDKMGRWRRSKYDHARIMEGPAGEPAAQKCTRCEQRKFECRRYRDDFSLPGYGLGSTCSRCRVAGTSCSLTTQQPRPTTRIWKNVG